MGSTKITTQLKKSIKEKKYGNPVVQLLIIIDCAYSELALYFSAMIISSSKIGFIIIKTNGPPHTRQTSTPYHSVETTLSGALPRGSCGGRGGRGRSHRKFKDIMSSNRDIILTSAPARDIIKHTRMRAVTEG